ncbi:MAG TPA: outer membrane protein transport protein [Burkholderiales bacterium]|nr:outer membrane protein transport protein [Burkholderiales bacterium]
MVRPGIRKTAASLAVASALAVGYSQAHAAAFALQEQNASGLGNSFAGQAAAAENASTIYFNPAGMSFLPAGPQFSLGGDYIKPSTKFSNGGSTAAGFPTSPATQRPLGSNGGEAGNPAFVPNVYFAMDVAPNLKAGIGISVPFGLATEYDSDWIGRFQAIKSEIQAVNINPSVSWKMNDRTALGFGLNYQRIDAELTNAVNTPGAVFGGVFQTVLGLTGNQVTAGTQANTAASAVAATGLTEGNVKVTGDDTAWGWNIGAMFQLAPETRLGLSYRSQMKYKVEGDVTFSNIPSAATFNAIDPTGALAGRFANGKVTLDLKLPDSFSAALSHKLDSKWTLLADVTWTGWSSIQQLRIVRDDGTELSNTPENFKDTWRVGVGGVYRYNDAWSIKTGVAYDQSPVNNTDRTARLPDNDRYWISIGAQYRLSKTATLDYGYAHLFVKNTSINQNAGNANVNGQLVGTYKASIDIIGIQYSQSF